MDIKEIKAIVDLMKRSGLTEFQLEEEGFKLKICRKNEDVQTIYQSATPVPFPVAPAATQPMPMAVEAPAKAKVDESKLIKSPMVGTFYTSPSPESPSFVKPGDTVVADTVVCIIEAMKVMNEIKAEMGGRIAEVLVANGESVEYGQPLFRIE